MASSCRILLQSSRHENGMHLAERPRPHVVRHRPLPLPQHAGALSGAPRAMASTRQRACTTVSGNHGPYHDRGARQEHADRARLFYMRGSTGFGAPTPMRDTLPGAGALRGAWRARCQQGRHRGRVPRVRAARQHVRTRAHLCARFRRTHRRRRSSRPLGLSRALAILERERATVRALLGSGTGSVRR
jgi:hypothetical protein